MTQFLEINLARDFSELPFGRYRSDGHNSAERFRDDVLIPAILDAGRVRVILNTRGGLGSSFLDEAFGGLVRKFNWSINDFLEHIEIVSERDPTYRERILSYAKESGSRA